MPNPPSCCPPCPALPCPVPGGVKPERAATAIRNFMLTVANSYNGDRLCLKGGYNYVPKPPSPVRSQRCWGVCRGDACRTSCTAVATCAHFRPVLAPHASSPPSAVPC